MHITLYLNNLWGISATARIASMLSKEFVKQGHKVVFIINKPPIEIETKLPIKVLKGKGDLQRALELAEIFENEKIDVCLGFMRPQSVVMALSKILKGKNFKTNLVGSVHNSDNYLSYNRWYHLPYRFLVRKLFQKLDAIVAVSESVKQDLIEAFFLPKDLIKVIHNPIDTDLVRQKAKEPIEPYLEKVFQQPTVVNVARMEIQKGLNHLINIFARVAKEIPSAQLVLIGDGSQRRKLEDQITNLGLENNVHLLGWKENPFKYIARSKVLALTSLWEGLALVILESMALGIPPVAFKTRGGHVEVLKDCCPLVDYPNEEAYAKVLIKILTDQSYYQSLKNNALTKVKEFSADRVAQKYLNLFEGLK
ncbi:MAG: glycosyltransferase [Aquificae bacterium]|nr:glycosyltransferase [Aquificota bacterium]